MKRGFFLSSLFGCSLSVLGPVSANAYYLPSKTTYWFGTSSTIPAAPNTVVYAGTVNAAIGGLCAFGETNCGTMLFGSNGGQNTLGTLSIGSSSVSAGFIEIQTPSAIANYKLTLTITGDGPSGDIYDVVAGTSIAGVKSIGTTKAVGPDGSSPGYTSGVLTPVFAAGGVNTVIYLSVTDLLQQWVGTASYTLPAALGYSGTYHAAAIGAGFDPESIIGLSYTLAAVPEPASLSLLAAGIATMGALRRRRRTNPTALTATAA